MEGQTSPFREMVQWLTKWKVAIRQSSAYYPQSNGRAEAGVKSLKRLLKGNIGSRGAINTDSIAYALLQYRNTPMRGINKSPSELALGRQLRDSIPLPRERYNINQNWARQLRNREKQMIETNEASKMYYNSKSKELKPLTTNDKVLCQNERTKKWDRSGVIIEVLPYRQYSIRMDGSGRISLRNRRHLQKLNLSNNVH